MWETANQGKYRVIGWRQFIPVLQREQNLAQKIDFSEDSESLVLAVRKIDQYIVFY